MNTGWECPKCHRVFAPTVTECAPCNAAAAWVPTVWVGDPPGTPLGAGGTVQRCFGCGQVAPCDGQTSGCMNPKLRCAVVAYDPSTPWSATGGTGGCVPPSGSYLA